MGPITAIIVAVGLVIVGVYVLLRGRNEVRTTPALILHPSYDADISTLENIRNGLVAQQKETT